VSLAKAAMLGLGLVGILALAAVSGRLGERPDLQTVSPEPEPEPPPVLEPLPRVLRSAPAREGEIVVLERLGRNRRVNLAIDDQAFEDLLAVLAEGDAAAFARLRDEGSLTVVPSGTLAQTLAVLTDRRLVRILGGDRDGHEGWVQEEFVHPPDPDDPRLATLRSGR
jgi:hypothetical protein